MFCTIKYKMNAHMVDSNINPFNLMSGRMDTEHDIFKYQDHVQDFKLNPSSFPPQVIALATHSSYILSMMLAD